MDFAESLRYYRKKAGLTQAELAEKLDVERSTVTQWETGRSIPRLARIGTISDVLNVPIGRVMTDYSMKKLRDLHEVTPGVYFSLTVDEPGGDASDVEEYIAIANDYKKQRAMVNRPLPPTGTVPVVNRIAAGDWHEAIRRADERWYVAEPILEAHPNSFYFVASGDSMDCVVPEGTLVLVDPNEKVCSGDVAVVLVDGSDATLDRIYFAGNTIVLHPESNNPLHRDISIDRTSPDSPSLAIVGKAVSYTAPDDWRP